MKLHRFFILLLGLLFITCGMRADGGDVLERMIRLPGMKGTVYSLLGKVSEQSGYLFVYDSKVVNNDIEVKTKRKSCTVRQAIYEIIGDRTSHLNSASYGEDCGEKNCFGRTTSTTGLFHHNRNFT